jgi:hypothetical protein
MHFVAGSSPSYLWLAGSMMSVTKLEQENESFPYDMSAPYDQKEQVEIVIERSVDSCVT